MPWYLWALAGAAVLGIAAFVTFKLLMRGKVYMDAAIKVDEEWIDLSLRFGSKLPKFFSKSATTIGFAICFRSYPLFLPQRVVGLYPVGRQLVANEIFHVVDRVRRGFRKYWQRIIWQTLLHPLNHDARPYEKESDAAQLLIMSGTYPGVDAEATLNSFR